MYNVDAPLACTHEFMLIAKAYAPPSLRPIPEGIAPELLERILLGVTTYLFECQTCHAHRHEMIVGSDRDTLEELMERTLQFGPQHVKNAQGEIFVVSKYLPPVKNPLELPMR